MACQIENLPTFSHLNHPLRIQRRGYFFSDEDSSKRHFESDAMNLFKEFDLCRNEDAFGSYRRLRDHQLCSTDKMAKISEEGDKYKIVMDVEGFPDSDLIVKASGPNELSVEGKQEIREGGSYSSRSIKRRFSLPGMALIEDATSVLSSDKFLTISIPKRITEIKDETQKNSSISSSTNVKVQTEGSKNFEDSFHNNNLEQIIQEDIQKLKDSSFLSNKNSSPLTERKGTQNIFDFQIIPRQSFFNDAYFENVRQSFQNSVNEMMANVRKRISCVKDERTFKEIIKIEAENVQALSITEDAKEHKIVLDVHGFSEADLKVRAISDYQLVVEGCVEKKTENTSCSHTFKKSFSLPPTVNIKMSTTALSSEGILTITVPKKTESIDFLIPIRNEGVASFASNTDKVEKTEESKLNTKVEKINLPNEHIVPVLRQDAQTSKKCIFQKQSDTASNGVEETSQSSKSDEVKMKKCEAFNKRKNFLPFNLGRDEVFNVSDELKETTQFTTDKTFPQSLKEVVEESKNTFSNAAAAQHTERSSSTCNNNIQNKNEHYIPVIVEAGLNFSNNNNLSNKINTTVQQTRDNFSRNKNQSNGVGMGSKNRSEHKNTELESSSRIIPISFKGSLFSESEFLDTRKYFEKAVDDALSKFNKSTFLEKHNNKKNNLKTSSQESSIFKNELTTSTLLDDVQNYKIVLDVFGFEKSELSVRTSGANEITIEGNSNKSKDGSVFKQSFQRSFKLPESDDLQRTSAALSTEGILTVTVPKRNKTNTENERIVPVVLKLGNETAKSKEIPTTVVANASDRTQDNKNLISIRNHREESVTSNASSSTTSNQREYVIPMSLEDMSETTSNADTISSTASTFPIDVLSRDTNKLVNRTLSTTSSQSSILSQCKANDLSNANKEIVVNGCSRGDNIESIKFLDFPNSTRDFMRQTDSLFNLPIVQRGYFFDDHFFQNSRPIFESALRNAMNRFNRSSSFIDDLDFFNSLRQTKFAGGENQISTLNEEDQFYKIVLDLQDYDENNIKVKVISENEILIEGEVKEKSGNSISRKCFKKNFVMPRLMNFRDAASALSADGVLSIKIPINT